MTAAESQWQPVEPPFADPTQPDLGIATELWKGGPRPQSEVAGVPPNRPDLYINGQPLTWVQWSTGVDPGPSRGTVPTTEILRQAAEKLDQAFAIGSDAVAPQAAAKLNQPPPGPFQGWNGRILCPGCGAMEWRREPYRLATTCLACGYEIADIDLIRAVPNPMPIVPSSRYDILRGHVLAPYPPTVRVPLAYEIETPRQPTSWLFRLRVWLSDRLTALACWIEPQ